MQNHSISVKNSIKAKNRKSAEKIVSQSKNRKNIAVKKYSIQNSKRNSIKIVKHDIYHHKKMNNLNNKKRCWKILSPVIV